MKIAYYITGHGYGHAVRSIEITDVLTQTFSDTIVHVQTTAPQWLFASLNDRVLFHYAELDFGCLQSNSFSVDKKATLDGYTSLIDKKQERVAREAHFLQAQNIDLVLSDITPFAFDAAKQAGIPGIAIGNFSWDWIYQAFLDDYPDYHFVVDDIRSSYAKADKLFRLPFYGDLSAFSPIEDVPLVGRKAKTPRQKIREQLGVEPSDKKLVLLGLRTRDMNHVNWNQVESFDHTSFIAVSRDIPLKNISHLTEGDLPFQDVLNACDAVITKPGYSIVSEIITNQTPVVYIPRRDFAEDPILVQALENYAVCEPLSQKEFAAGQWEQAFTRLLQKPQNWPPIRTDGAMVLAEKIHSFFG